MKKNILKLFLVLCASMVVSGCLLPSRPAVDLPDRYDGWWGTKLYVENPNSRISDFQFIFINYEISKAPDLYNTSIVTREVVRRLKRKHIDYSKYVSFCITIFCKNYAEIEEIFQNPSFNADNKKFDLDNYIIDKKTEKTGYSKDGEDGIIEIIGKIPKDEFIEMIESESFTLEFDVMGEPDAVKFSGMNVYEDTFIVP